METKDAKRGPDFEVTTLVQSVHAHATIAGTPTKDALGTSMAVPPPNVPVGPAPLSHSFGKSTGAINLQHQYAALNGSI
jgi:hypothetical protein